MKTDRRQHLQDIYSANSEDDGQSQQPSTQMMSQYQRELRRQKIISLLFGLLLLAVTVGLTVLIIYRYKITLRPEKTEQELINEYLPLSEQDIDPESELIMDYFGEHGIPKNPDQDIEGEHPLSTFWVKRATMALIKAEAAERLAQTDKEALNTAAGYYEEALEIFPEMKGVKIPLGNLYFQLERYDQAIELLETVPRDELTYETLNNMGVGFTKGEKYEQAETYLKLALEKTPEYKNALKNLAVLYKKQDRRQEAIDTYGKYLTLYSNDFDARTDYARFLVQAGEWQEAAIQLRMLTKAFPSEHTYFRLLAEAEKQLGNTEAALAALERYNQLSDIP